MKKGKKEKIEQLKKKIDDVRQASEEEVLKGSVSKKGNSFTINATVNRLYREAEVLRIKHDNRVKENEMEKAEWENKVKPKARKKCQKTDDEFNSIANYMKDLDGYSVGKNGRVEKKEQHRKEIAVVYTGFKGKNCKTTVNITPAKKKDTIKVVKGRRSEDKEDFIKNIHRIVTSVTEISETTNGVNEGVNVKERFKLNDVKSINPKKKTQNGKMKHLTDYEAAKFVEDILQTNV